MPHHHSLPAGGEREARCAGQGWCAREGWRGRSAWEDGTLMLTLSHPRGTPTQLSLGCLQLRLRAVPFVPGFTRTFRACWSQGRARGCWSSRAGECTAALSSVPGQDKGEPSLCSPAHLPTLSSAPGHRWPPWSQGREGKEPGCEVWGAQGCAGHWHPQQTHLSTCVSPAGRASTAGGCAAGRARESPP